MRFTDKVFVFVFVLNLSLLVSLPLLFIINDDLFNGSLADGLCGQHQCRISRVYACIFHMFRDGVRDNLAKRRFEEEMSGTNFNEATALPTPLILTDALSMDRFLCQVPDERSRKTCT